MLGITFSAEAEPSAAERISDCFQYFESRMDVIRLPRYCKVLDSIKIILSLRRMKRAEAHQLEVARGGNLRQAGR